MAFQQEWFDTKYTFWFRCFCRSNIMIWFVLYNHCLYIFEDDSGGVQQEWFDTKYRFDLAVFDGFAVPTLWYDLFYTIISIYFEDDQWYIWFCKSKSCWNATSVIYDMANLHLWSDPEVNAFPIYIDNDKNLRWFCDRKWLPFSNDNPMGRKNHRKNHISDLWIPNMVDFDFVNQNHCWTPPQSLKFGETSRKNKW